MGPIMTEAVAVLRGLMSSGWCARRREPSVTMIAQPDQGPAIEKPLPPAIEKQSVPGLQNNANKTHTKKTSTLAPAVAKRLSSKQHQLNPTVEVLMPSKSTSDAEKSTTAGSGDLTEDDRFYESGTDFDVAPMVMSAFALSQTGLPAPPGLEFPGLELSHSLNDPLADRLKTHFLQERMPQGTKLNSQAAPFVPTFSKTAAPPNAKKISISNELDRGQGTSTSNPSNFTDATCQLQKSLFQLKDALAEWEDSKYTQEEPALKAAAKVMAEKQTAELMSSISSSLRGVNVPAPKALGNPTAGNQMFDCSQQPCNGQVMEPGFAHCASQLPTVDPALAWQVASLEQQSWQIGYNFMIDQQQSMQAFATAVCMTPEDQPTDTLRASLQELGKMPAGCVFTVRRIYRLGLDSPAILADHFALYGAVNKVLICHSKQKSKRRVRAAGLGFVCMSSAEAVSTILSFGDQHVINGVAITVQPYEARAPRIATQEQEVEEGMLEEQIPETEEMRFQ